MRTAPIPVKHAVRFVKTYHRKLPHAHHRLWAVGLWVGRDLMGVALVGAPVARMLADTKQPGEDWPPPAETLEVVRVAVIEGVKNGCSMLYGAVSRAARAMGASNLLTYIEENEPGTTMKASGWVEDNGLFGGGQADRPSRPRKMRSSDDACKRRRFWAPWSIKAKEIKAKEIKSAL